MSSPYYKALSKPEKQSKACGILSVGRFLRSVFFYGPKQLLTSRISKKCAAVMMALCAPSLLCSSLLTIPAFLFPSPNQNAYFYFSMVINEDPTRWLVIFLATACAILSLAVPAFMPQPSLASEY